MKLVYWVARCKDDDSAYNIRERTKKVANAARIAAGEDRFEPVEKVVVEYDDGFDLLKQCLGEGGLP